MSWAGVNCRSVSLTQQTTHNKKEEKMPTKKSKKNTKVKAKVRDLKPRKDAKGGGQVHHLGSYGGLGAHGSH